jgi:hypothetical protein
MFSVSLVLGETMEEARPRRLAPTQPWRPTAGRTGALSFLSGVDFSKFPLDEPLGRVQTKASRGLTTLLTSGTGKATLARDADRSGERRHRFRRHARQCRGRNGRGGAGMGGDGFMITEA